MSERNGSVKQDVVDKQEGGGQEEKKGVLICERKVKNRKVALIISYLGAGYQGMQRNPNAKTIEGDLEKALHLSGGIQKDTRFDFGKLQWCRAARTDKGVSAVIQVVSIQMLVPKDDPQDMIPEINKHLPKQIRVMDLIRTTPKFDAKQLCDYRVYEYLLPVWMLNPNACTSAEDILDVITQTSHKTYEQQKTEEILKQFFDGQQCCNFQTDYHNFDYNQEEDQIFIPQQFCEGEFYSEDFQLSGELIQNFNQILQKYEGTHNFYNFTAREKPDSGHVVRYLKQFYVGGLINFKRAKQGSQNCDMDTSNQPCQNEEQKSQHNINDNTEFNTSNLQETQNIVDNSNNNTEQIIKNEEDNNVINGSKSTSKIEICEYDNSKNECWICIKVCGQSFLLHQIRKMISLAVATGRKEAPVDAIETALIPTRDLNIPPAPAAPLYLNECSFASYNDKWGNAKKEHCQQKILPLQDCEKQISEFKQQILHPYIHTFCNNLKVFEEYSYNLKDSVYNFSKWKDMEEVRVNPKYTAKRKREQSQTTFEQKKNKQPKLETPCEAKK